MQVNETPQYSRGLILLVPDKPDSERDAVAAEWHAGGGEVLRLGRFWDPPEVPKKRVRVYGGGAFAMVLAQKLDLVLVSPSDMFLAEVGEEWLGRSLQVLPLRQVLRDGVAAFVKPVLPKQFEASVYRSRANLEAMTEGLEPETMVFVSSVVEMQAEVRCFVLHNRVVASGLYEGYADLDAAVRFAESFLQKHKLPETLVLDIGTLANGRWVVVEANATWGAGLNGCSPEGAAKCLVYASRADDDEVSTK